MKNVFMIHGYNGDTRETFGPYLEREFERMNLKSFFPVFPIREEATFESWSDEFDKYKKFLNEESIIVAHSLGTQFIPKYIANNNIKIATYISIAGFINDNSGREDLKGVVDRFKLYEDDFVNFINLTQNRFAIYSDNDHLNPQEELERYAEKIDAEKIFIKEKGHFGRRSGVKELPEVIKIIEKY